MPGRPRSRRRAARAASTDLLRLGLRRRRRTGPPGSSRPARRRRRRAAGRRRRCRGRPSSARASRAIVGAVVGGRGQRRGAAEGGEVVQPHLDRDRAARQAALAQPLGDACRPAGSSSPSISLRSVRSVVVGALDADRLGLALGLRRRGRPRPGPAARARRRAPGRAAAPARPRLSRSRSATVCTPDPAQPLGGGRPDAGDHGDLHRAQQVLLGAGRRRRPGRRACRGRWRPWR